MSWNALKRLALSLIGLLLAGSAHAQQRPELLLRGIDGEPAANLRLHLEAGASDQDWGRLRTIRKRVEQALQPYGYYEVRVRAERSEQQLRLEIQPGPRVVWAPPQLDLQGPAADLRPFRQLLQQHPFVEGQPLFHPDYDHYRDRWLQLSEEEGFFDAKWRARRLEVDRRTARATAVLSLDSGPRYHFGHLHYRGGGVRAEVLDRLDLVRPGRPYRQAEVRALHRALQETGYFSQVQLQTERREDQQVDLVARLTEAPLDRYTLGAGFGTDTGPRGRVRWQRPRVNSRGHKLESELSVSRPRTVLGSQYLLPLSHPLHHFGRLSASLEHKEIRDTRSRLLDVGYDIHRHLAHDWQISYGAHLLNERYRQGTEPWTELTYLLPGVQLSQLRLPPGPDPHRGHKSWIELVGSDRRLGASRAFLRLRLGHARLWSPLPRHRVIARAEWGAIGTSDLHDVPSSLRFFTGGDRTVRGFDYESLSPRNDRNERTGGRFLNVASLEYSYRFAEHWRAALFTDAGRAFNHDSDPWHQSVGVGLRWLSPVGQVRVDLAMPIDDDRESGWRLHIFLGPPL